MLESFFNKVADLKTCSIIKKRLQHRCFPVKFAIFLRTAFYRTPPVATFETKYELQLPFYYILEYEISTGMRAMRKKTNHIHASAANLLHIRIGNLGWCKCRRCKNKAREIDCLWWREVSALLIASAKIPEREESISPCRFYEWLPDC